MTLLLTRENSARVHSCRAPHAALIVKKAPNFQVRANDISGHSLTERILLLHLSRNCLLTISQLKARERERWNEREKDSPVSQQAVEGQGQIEYIRTNVWRYMVHIQSIVTIAFSLIYILNPTHWPFGM